MGGKQEKENREPNQPKKKEKGRGGRDLAETLPSTIDYVLVDIVKCINSSQIEKLRLNWFPSVLQH